ncbi:MAG: hypothetical protein AAGI14_02895 [Pseudomonadota bacterium]
MTRKTPLFLTLSAAALSIAGCSQFQSQQASEPEAQQVVDSETEKPPVRLGPPISTIKPGAGIVIESTLSDGVVAGGNGTATLSVLEPFSEGTLTLTSTGSEGLRVFGAETTARLDMSLEGPHTVRLSYAADADGVYYINTIATTESNGIEESRAHAVRVEIGDWESAAEEQKSAQLEVSADGETVVIMEAEETIE